MSDSVVTTPSRSVSLPLLASLTLPGLISITLYVPALPEMTASLRTTAGSAQLTMTTFLIGFAIAQLVYGPLSDRVGRRPATLAGLAVFVAGSALAALSTTIEMLIVARLVQALGGCAGPVLARAIVRDLKSGAELARTLASINAVLALAPSFGLAIGGLSEELLGWRGCFVLLTGFGLAVWLWALTALPETNTRLRASGQRRAIAHDYAELLGDRALVGYVVCGAAIVSGAYIWHTGSSFLFVGVIGLSPGVFGLLGLFTASFYFTGSLAARRYAGVIPALTLVGIGSSLAVVGCGAFLLLTVSGIVQTVPILIAGAVYAAGLGLTSPTAAAGALALHPSAAGTASAIYGFAQMALGVVATSGMASVAPTSPVAFAATMLTMALIGWATWLWLRKAS
jgi:DHA1 family bicyclomycin/chloramphenicol resistance-like MFS transporter